MSDEVPDINEVVGQMFREIREERGLTQYQAAELVGTPQYRLSRIETGRASMKLSTVEELAERWGYDIEINFVARPETTQKAS